MLDKTKIVKKKKSTTAKPESTPQQESPITKDTSSKQEQTKEEDYTKLVEKLKHSEEKVVQLLKEQVLLQEKNVRLNKQLIITAAEYDNTKKLMHSEVVKAKQYAHMRFAEEVIEIIENIFRASESIPQDDLQNNKLLKNVHEGFAMTLHDSLAVLERNNIHRIFPVIGDEFNHKHHYALSTVMHKTYKDGQIVKVLRAGYTINDKLLCPAEVMIVKNNPKD